MSEASDNFDLVVIGAGPAGVFAALRAADLGARTAIVSSGAFGGMAANDGPVRTLAHAARLVREARQLGRYGIAGCEPVLDYPRLLQRVAEVVDVASRNAALRPQLDQAGVAIFENVGPARFLDPRLIALPDGRRLRAGRTVICTGGVSRRPAIPGIELTATHSDAWGLKAVPESAIVVGGGATGLQVASVFNALGTRIELFESKDRILAREDEDFGAAVAEGFRARGIGIHVGFGAIDRFEPVAGGVAMHYSKDGQSNVARAALVVAALGWVAKTDDLDLPAAGIAIDPRGFVTVDEYLRTSAPGIYAAGDVTGRMMLVPQAIHQGFAAATNALSGNTTAEPGNAVAPMGSFTDPEYAQVGLTERRACERGDAVAVTVRCDSATRAIIDGQTEGFCKLIADRASGRIIGCHMVGERAAEFARIPLAYPTYAGILGRAALMLADRLQQSVALRPHWLDEVQLPY
jgi:pyruvate/2-oxoglutarate dehydrogenase complex dihydrolipoamide dehydrogenase (E3) component